MDRWLAAEFGVPVDGRLDLYQFWKEQCALYGPSLTPELVVGGRDEEREILQKHRDGRICEVAILAESIEEGALFIAAAFLLGGEAMEGVRNRLLFVGSASAAEWASSAAIAQFLVPMTNAAFQRMAGVSGTSPHILRPVTNSPGAQPPSASAVIRLGPVKRTATVGALRERGMDEREANRVAEECKGSLSAVLWTVSNNFNVKFDWLVGENAPQIAPLLLAGQWDASNNVDSVTLGRLTNRPPDGTQGILGKWSSPTGPMAKRGQVWEWRAWSFNWSALTGAFYPELIERFSRVAVDVLTTRDPQLDIPVENRWAAVLFGKQHPISADLRGGLVRSVVRCAIDAPDCPILAGVAEDIVGRVLPVSFDAWQSLAKWLPDLAEAAPNIFLKRLEYLLGEPEAALNIFQESGPMHSSSLHTHILWALERLAWSPDYFSMAALMLGRLAAIDPGGNVGKRPTESLRGVFSRRWPHTSANDRERLDVLDELYGRYGEVGWKLILALMPAFGILAGNSRPQWRDWADPRSEPNFSRADAEKLFLPVQQRLLAWAGRFGQRWAEVVNSLTQWEGSVPGVTAAALAALTAAPADEFSDADRALIAGAVRRVVSAQREHAHSPWSISPQTMTILIDLAPKFEPSEAKARFGWLFNNWPELDTGQTVGSKEYDEALTAQRQRAMRQVINENGLLAAFALGDGADAPATAGLTLAQLAIPDNEVDTAVAERLTLEPAARGVPGGLQLAIGFVEQKFSLSGSVWLDAFLAANAPGKPAAFFANVAWAMPARQETWTMLRGWGSEADAVYWERTPIAYLADAPRDLKPAMESLLNAGRPYRALALVGRYERAALLRNAATATGRASELGAALLRAVLDGAAAQPPQRHVDVSSSFGDDLATVITLLEATGEPTARVAAYEWQWAESLEQTARGLKAIWRHLADSPAAFVKLICAVYKPRNPTAAAEPETTEQDARRPKRALSILTNWKAVPGATYEIPPESRYRSSNGEIVFGNGSVDGAALMRWVVDARTGAAAADRAEVADQSIGNLLAWAPKDADGSWPAREVCGIIEKINSKEIDVGIMIGVMNRRGSFWVKTPGAQEANLSEMFAALEDRIREEFPRTSRILKELKLSFQGQAKSERDRAQKEEFDA